LSLKLENFWSYFSELPVPRASKVVFLLFNAINVFI
jgi:hypothetical protein